ncbi:limbic system-associated membrane protein-like [Onthophagus taurus]|uniref:limbic system-associated membrane protein-like n=1 Tax=Onthophagus taurus TaxID=166361 RepID=UPI000C20608E|nr:limbic system-associated membrane protein-like [Onthophagus taurus]
MFTSSVVFGVYLLIANVTSKQLDSPRFSEPLLNVTSAVGREAILKCDVENLGVFKVAWLRVDTQTILTIQTHIITKSVRIGVTRSEHKTWYLHIREVKETDRGWYMCQINTDPMIYQIAYLDVIVPPDIIDYQTSNDITVQEGSNVTLRCMAKGSPNPTILWRREDGRPIHLGQNHEVNSVEGPVLNINKASRQQMGPYLCIASNKVPPSVSKRIHLTVQFPPAIWIQYQLIGAYDGQQVSLECQSEAFPKSISYWTRDKADILAFNDKYEPIIEHTFYKVFMKLVIKKLEATDYGIYKCVSKNSLGETDGTINVYRIPKPTMSNKNIYNKSLISGAFSNNLLTYQLGSSTRGKLSSENSNRGHQNLIKLSSVFNILLFYYLI